MPPLDFRLEVLYKKEGCIIATSQYFCTFTHALMLNIPSSICLYLYSVNSCFIYAVIMLNVLLSVLIGTWSGSPSLCKSRNILCITVEKYNLCCSWAVMNGLQSSLSSSLQALVVFTVTMIQKCLKSRRSNKQWSWFACYQNCNWVWTTSIATDNFHTSNSCMYNCYDTCIALMMVLIIMIGNIVI